MKKYQFLYSAYLKVEHHLVTFVYLKPPLILIEVPVTCQESKVMC